MASALGVGRRSSYSKDIQPSVPMLGGPRVDWEGSPVIVNPGLLDHTLHLLLNSTDASCEDMSPPATERASVPSLPLSHSRSRSSRSSRSSVRTASSPRTTPRSLPQAIAILQGQTPHVGHPARASQSPAPTNPRGKGPRGSILPSPKAAVTAKYLLDLIESVQSFKGDMSKDKEQANLRRQALQESPCVRVVLSNHQRLVIPLDQAEPLVAGIERIVEGSYPDAEERCSIRTAKRCVLLVAAKLDDGGLFPCVCQTDHHSGTLELRQGWEAVLERRNLKAGDIVGVQVDQYSTPTLIILRIKVWDNQRKGKQPDWQNARTCAEKLHLARNGTLSLGTGVKEGTSGSAQAPSRAYSIDLDAAISEEFPEDHGLPNPGGLHSLRRWHMPSPLPHSQHQIKPKVIRPEDVTAAAGFQRFMPHAVAAAELLPDSGRKKRSRGGH